MHDSGCLIRIRSNATAIAIAQIGLRVPLARAVLERADMSTSTLPSIAALQSNDDGQLTAELRLAELRKQVAVVRALADQIEHLARPGDTEGLHEQLVEEMARLGCRLFEVAAAMTRSSPEDSGVFARPSSSGAGSGSPGEPRSPASGIA